MISIEAKARYLVLHDVGTPGPKRILLEKSLELCEKLSLQIYIARSINNLGNCFFGQGQYDSATAYFTKYRRLVTQLKDDRKMGLAYGNIAKTYLKQGIMPYSKAFLDSAQQKYTKIKYYEGLAFLHNVRSDLYRAQNNIELAIQEAQAAIALSDSISMPSEKLNAQERLISIYIHP